MRSPESFSLPHEEEHHELGGKDAQDHRQGVDRRVGHGRCVVPVTVVAKAEPAGSVMLPGQ